MHAPPPRGLHHEQLHPVTVDNQPRPHLAPAARAQAVWYGASMLRQFGWFYRALGLSRLLGRIDLDESSAERVRTAAVQGPVVYVLLSHSNLDHLTLNTVLNRRRLPLSVWAPRVLTFPWQPVVAAWSELFIRVQHLLSDGFPDAVTSGWMSRAVASGAPVTLFLEVPPTLRQRLRGQTSADTLQALLDAQAQCARPIQVLPTLVVWDRAPDRDNAAIQQFFSGRAEQTSWFGTLRNALTRSRGAFVQVGEPIDLAAFVERIDEPARRARTLRRLLRTYLRRETRVVRGPTLLAPEVMRSLVLDNPPMRELAKDEAHATGRSLDQIQRQMNRDYDLIAARFRWGLIRALDLLLRPLWTRVYSGVDVRDEDLERIRAAMRDGTAILMPSHKSHFDYVLLSWVLYEHKLIVPHVVAGANLAIWPVSILLRGAGGFFIKRSFAGERIFPAVFARYLRELIVQGYPVEFFLEGGRSRTGKLLPPRVGVLGMVLEAAELCPVGREVTLLPIQLSYEQVAEEAAYAAELSGAEKKPETMGQLVRARSVLSRRFGRVYLRVGEPVGCSALVGASTEQPAWSERPRLDQKEQLHRLGERIIHRIGQATLALPTSLTALALLAHHRRAIRHPELVARIERFDAFLERKGVERAASLEHPIQARSQALRRFESAGLLTPHHDADGRVWGINIDTRITLEAHKNQLLHAFVAAGYVAIAARPIAEPIQRDALLPGIVAIAWVLRREFILDPDAPVSALLDEGLADLVAHGALAQGPDGYTIADIARIGEIYALFRNFLESAWLVLSAAPAKPTQDRKAFAASLQRDGAAWLADGRLSRSEALSSVSLDNAIGAFVEDGTLTLNDAGHLGADEARRAHVLALLDGWLH